MHKQSDSTKHCMSCGIALHITSYCDFSECEKHLIFTGEKIKCEKCKKNIIPLIMKTI